MHRKSLFGANTVRSEKPTASPAPRKCSLLLFFIIACLLRPAAAPAQDIGDNEGPDAFVFPAVTLREIGEHGRVVDDPQATVSGKALEITRAWQNHHYKREGIRFEFGGKQGPAGAVTVTFRLKIGSNKGEEQSFYIAISEGEYRGNDTTHFWPRMRKLIRPRHFDEANVYQEFSMNYVRKPGQEFAAVVSWSLLSAPLTVDTVTLTRAPEALGIGNLKVDRLWYRKGASAKVNVTAANHTDKRQTAVLRCEFIGDMDSVHAARDQPLTLDPNEVRTLTIPMTVGASEWGHEVRVSLLQAKNEVMSVSDMVTIGDNIFKVSNSHVGSDHHLRGLEGEGKHRPLKDIHVPITRMNYQPLTEVFSWSPGMAVDKTPDEELWLSGQGGYRLSKTGLRTWIEECHNEGIAVVTYNQFSIMGPVGLDWARRHPQWVAYAPSGRPSLGADVEQVERQRDPDPPNWHYGTYGMGALWIGSQELMDHMADELIGATQMFGFDGVRWDGHPMLTAGHSTMPDQSVVVSKKLINYRGEEVTIDDPDEFSAKLMQRFNARISKALPDYAFGYNWPPTHSVIWPERMPKTWKALVPNAYMLDEDLNTRGWADSDTSNLWSRFAHAVVESVDYVRPEGGYHYTGLLTKSGVVGCHLASFVYAGGSRIYGGVPLHYYPFGLRHAELLFSNDIVRVTENVEKVAQVEAPAATLWREYVNRWPMGNGRERTVVHVLNAPATPHVSEAPAPSIQENVRVTAFAPKPGASCTRAWVLSPDWEPVAHEVQVTAGQDKTTLTIPQLLYWSITVFEWDH